jgi:hypothetical protein
MQRDEYVMPPDERRCTHTYEDGRRCRAWRSVQAGELCTGHAGLGGMTSERARMMQERSVRAKRRRAYARQAAKLSPRALTADDVLRIRAAEDAVELADAMLAPLNDPRLTTTQRAEHAAWVQDRARPDLRPDVLAALTLERARAQLADSSDPRGEIGTLSDRQLELLAGDVIEGEAIELTG